jgi:hypothetical protein
MDADMQQLVFQPFGYERDTELSNDNVAAHYNPTTKNLIYVVAGTSDFLDWTTNFVMFFGFLKYTERYKEADTGLKNAKIKYGLTSGCDVSTPYSNKKRNSFSNVEYFILYSIFYRFMDTA